MLCLSFCCCAFCVLNEDLCVFYIVKCVTFCRSSYAAAGSKDLCVFCTLKCTKMRLADPLGQLTASPDPLQTGKGERRGEQRNGFRFEDNGVLFCLE